MKNKTEFNERKKMKRYWKEMCSLNFWTQTNIIILFRFIMYFKQIVIEQINWINLVNSILQELYWIVVIYLISVNNLNNCSYYCSCLWIKNFNWFTLNAINQATEAASKEILCIFVKKNTVNTNILWNQYHIYYHILINFLEFLKPLVKK